MILIILFIKSLNYIKMKYYTLYLLNNKESNTFIMTGSVLTDTN